MTPMRAVRLAASRQRALQRKYDRLAGRAILDALAVLHELGRQLPLAGGGRPVPAQQQVVERMRAPRVGDLVVETSSWRRKGRPFDADRVGWLREIHGDRDCGEFIVEPLDCPGRRVRWGNASFVAVPPPGESLNRWAGVYP